MARYIDADALTEHIQKLKVVTDDWFGMGIARGIERAETAIQMQPTADVVPKSEAAREIFEEIIQSVLSKIPHQVMPINSDRDFGDGVIFGEQEALYDVINELVALKNKYTGGVNNGITE